MNGAITGGIQLDVCRVCQFVWFDAQEFEQMPLAPVIQAEPQLPQAAREALALYQVKRLEESVAETGPPSEWQHVPAIFGMPVECDSHDLTREPLLTWSLAGLIAIISILALYFQPWLMEELAFIPADMWRHGGLTWITPFFLHGGAVHLLTNLYYFLAFGNNVEDYLGHWRYALLLLVAVVAANFFHAAGDPRATIPCVGASGGISAIIAFYALKFPHARLGLYLTYYFRVRWIRFPAWAGLALWIALQIFGAMKQLGGFSNVSALAHLGGAMAGLVAWIFWGWRERLSGEK
jgi:membrane associated rhomboid family serine protease